MARSVRRERVGATGGKGKQGAGLGWRARAKKVSGCHGTDAAGGGGGLCEDLDREFVSGGRDSR